MNYLELCQRLRQESGVPGTGPASTVDQTGFDKKIVDWIATAYGHIQSLHQTWRFLRQDFEFNTVASQREYSVSDASITNLSRWKINEYGDIRMYLAATGISDEQYIDFVHWDDYRFAYLIGNSRTAEGRPSIVTITPDNNLDFFHVPDAVYTVKGEYWQTPDVFSGNTDEPIIPSRFHMAIVWKALMYYGAYDAADERYSHGQNEYKIMKKRLEFDQLPKITFGGPLV